jgi:hypothetical protein
MSATTTYTCDRCGEERDSEHVSTTVARRRPHGYWYGPPHYLCPPCGDKLRAFLHGVPA